MQRAGSAPPQHEPHTAPADLTSEQFAEICDRLHAACGISISPGKEYLVQARLAKRLRELGYEDYAVYVQHLAADRSGLEAEHLVDLLTTNKTGFFREQRHFDFLRDAIVPELLAHDEALRIWSAGCSSGEEPLSAAMTLMEALPRARAAGARILATDISRRMLTVARKSVYDEASVQNVPADLRSRYFTCVQATAPRAYHASEALTSMLHIARLNLVLGWPMKGPFDVIFCRNVMIYFDAPTRAKLLARFWELLRPNGYLFVGHAEALSLITHRFQYVQPAIYVKQPQES